MEIILRQCLEYEKGNNVMEKLSGKSIYDEKIWFRWCLRGPTIDPETHAEPLHKRVKKKVQKGGKVLWGWARGDSKEVEISSDDG